MKPVYLLLQLFVTTSVDAFNPLSYFYERCDSNWISFNATGLRRDLDTELFGQHIASRLILKTVSGFMANKNPKKPLVLSLHGLTGTGKNFASSLIARNIYAKGMDSSFVHVFVGSVHFPHSSQIETYKSHLKQWIQDGVAQCERSMFIFDHMDQMHPGLIDTILPFLSYYRKIENVSYRKAIFIFLSNAGADVITQTALEFWKKGKNQTDIELNDLEQEILESLFNRNLNGFWHSRLIEDNTIDFFIPFLPLQYEHVVQCVLALMKANGLPQRRDLAERIARHVNYFPKVEKIFSKTGCNVLDNRLFYEYS